MSPTPRDTPDEPTFPFAFRGYEPAEVDRAVRGLLEQLDEAHERVRQLEESGQEQVLAEPAETPAAAAPEPASFSHLGERVGKILALAEEEAAAIRDQARADSEASAKEAEQAAVHARTEAEQYAERHLGEVQAQAERRARRREAGRRAGARDRAARRRGPPAGGRGALRAAAREVGGRRGGLRVHVGRAAAAYDRGVPGAAVGHPGAAGVDARPGGQPTRPGTA